VPYLRTISVMIHEESLYQVYAPLPYLTCRSSSRVTMRVQASSWWKRYWTRKGQDVRRNTSTFRYRRVTGCLTLTTTATANCRFYALATTCEPESHRTPLANRFDLHLPLSMLSVRGVEIFQRNCAVQFDVYLLTCLLAYHVCMLQVPKSLVGKTSEDMGERYFTGRMPYAAAVCRRRINKLCGRPPQYALPLES